MKKNHIPSQLDDPSSLSALFRRWSHTAERVKSTPLNVQHEMTRYFLCQEPCPANEKTISRFFGPSRFPGTSSIGDRKKNPEIFQDTSASEYESYDTWINRIIRKTIHELTLKGLIKDMARSEEDIEEIVRKVIIILEFQTVYDTRLCEAIPQQMYEDIFIRILMFLLNPESPNNEAHLYQEFNAICHRISLALIILMEQKKIIGNRTFDFQKLIQIAVLSGHVGINLKSSSSAASALLNRNFLPIDKAWARNMEAVHAVPEDMIMKVAEYIIELTDKPEGQFGLESLQKYNQEVLETQTPTLLVFFCDDYMESMIDMKRIEAMLQINPKLLILFIPRAGRYGNDIAHEDVKEILSEKLFEKLHIFHQSKRFHISKNGPKSGCIDPRFIGKELMRDIESLGKGRNIVFETKGCRNFEMLHGNLYVPWYASFNCNRALSIRTVQIDGSPVFLRIPAGLKAYDGFLNPKIGYSSIYKTADVKFARMTTLQLYMSLQNDMYKKLLERVGDELTLNKNLIAICEKMQITFSELIDLLTDSEEDFFTLFPQRNVL